MYMAALVSAHPSATLELLAYMLTIIKASQQYDSLYWRSYDTNYRITAAASGNRSWSRLDTDLYTRFFTGRAKPLVTCNTCDSTEHLSADCPQMAKRVVARKREAGKFPPTGIPTTKRRQWPSDICAKFNAKGSCSFGQKCKFCHACGECAEITQLRHACPSLSLPRKP